MKRGRYFTALFLALVLMVGMIVPAQAAGLRLQWTQDGDSVELKLRGLGEESIYGVQLELTVDGTYTGAFTPAAAEAYSPECRVSSSDRRTRVIIYITSQKPLNSGGSLEVGGLTLSGGFTMPASATVTLLSHELKPLTSANGTKIPASGQVIDGEDSDDEDDESPTYRVRVSSAKNGQVVSDVLEAPARSLVKLTVTPENRYDLMEPGTAGKCNSHHCPVVGEMFQFLNVLPEIHFFPHQGIQKSILFQDGTDVFRRTFWVKDIFPGMLQDIYRFLVQADHVTCGNTVCRKQGFHFLSQFFLFFLQNTVQEIICFLCPLFGL